jgi:hypothetical protein
MLELATASTKAGTVGNDHKRKSGKCAGRPDYKTQAVDDLTAPALGTSDMTSSSDGWWNGSC